MKRAFYIILAVLLFNFLAPVSILADWEGPIGAPPSNNRYAPIDISATSQIKAGGLTVQGLLTAEAGLNIGGLNINSNGIFPQGIDVTNTGVNAAVYGHGAGNGIVGLTTAVNTYAGIYGQASNGGWAGYFQGPLGVTGNTGLTGNLTVSGNVGIGIANPGTLLHLNSGQSITTIQSTTTDSPSILRFQNTSLNSNVNVGQIQFNNNASNIMSQIAGHIGSAATEGFLTFSTRNADSLGERVRITKEGNVGIGTTAPGAKLEVAGQVKITGGTPGAGKVLTSDGTGLATWELVAGGGLPAGTSGQTLRRDGANWVANSVIYNNGTNVGIGTTNPLAKLAVNGESMFGSSALNVANDHNLIYGNIDEGSDGNLLLLQIEGNRDFFKIDRLGNTTQAGTFTVGIGDRACPFLENEGSLIYGNVRCFEGVNNNYLRLQNNLVDVFRIKQDGNIYFGRDNEGEENALQSLISSVHGIKIQIDSNNNDNGALFTVSSFKPNTGEETLFQISDQTNIISILGPITDTNSDVVIDDGLTVNGNVTLSVGSINTAEIADNAITTAKIFNGTILFADIASNSCTNGQIMKYNGAWACGDDVGGGLPAGTSGQTLRRDGVNWVANSVIYNNGTNVGIGTTNPGEKLDVSGNVKLSGILMNNGDVRILVDSDNDGSNNFRILNGAGGSMMYVDESGNAVFSGNTLSVTDSSNLYLNGNGNVQIRVDYNNNDDNYFKINNGDNTTVFQVEETGTTTLKEVKFSSGPKIYSRGGNVIIRLGQ